jgi:hypothetical protein
MALLTAAVLGPAWRLGAVEWRDRTPLELPLAEAPAASRVDFSIDRPGRYDIAIEIDRPQGRDLSQRAECLLGFDRVDCSGTEPVRVDWHLSSHHGGEVALTRSSDGTFTPQSIARALAAFDAVARGRYAIRVDRSSVSALAGYRPRLVVMPSARLNRDRSSVTAAVWLTAVIVGLAGLLLLETRP